MAAIFTTNVSGTAFGAVFELKQLLKQAGWKVTQSGDGDSAFSPSGDVISHGGSGAGGMNNTGSWFVIRQPFARGAQREFCFHKASSATNQVVRWIYSKAAGFTGGSPGATTPPTASDGIQMGSIVPQPVHSAQMMAETDGAFGFWLASYSNSPSPTAAILFDPIIEGTYPPEDVDPYVLYAAGAPLRHHAWFLRTNTSNVDEPFVTNSAVGVSTSGEHGLRTWMTDTDVIPVAANLYFYWQGGTRRYPVNMAGAHPVANRNALMPVVYTRSQETGVNGAKGVSTYMRFDSNGTPATAATSSDKKRIRIGHVWLPWDGVTTPTSQQGSYDVYDMWPSAEDTTPPEVEITSPPPYSAILPTTPLRVRVTDGTGLRRVMLLAEFAGSRVYEVVHDGTQFAPLYRSASVRQSIANGYQYELRRSGGWPGSPTLRVAAIDVAGNEA